MYLVKSRSKAYLGFNNLCYCNSLPLWGKVCSYPIRLLHPVITNNCSIFTSCPYWQLALHVKVLHLST